MPATSITDLCEQSGRFQLAIAGGSVTRVLDVWMDGPSYRPDQVKDEVAAWGADFGSKHPTYGAFANLFNVTQQSDSRDHWRVEIEYGNTAPDPNDPNPPDPQYRDPLLDPPDISWVTKQREVALSEDVDGDAILNYAKRPYDPPITDWRPVGVLRVSRNEASATFATLGTYLNKVNSTPWLGAAARHVLCTDIQATKQRRTYRADNNAPILTVSFWRVSYEFEYIEEDPDPDDLAIGPWDAYIFQADYEALTVSGSKTEPILDDEGEPVRTPQPIDAGGRAIDKSELPGAAVHKGHEIKREIDFNALGIVL